MGFAIDSALRQSFREIEVLLISDGESDDTWVAVEPFIRLDRRVRLYTIPRTGRVATVTNYGLSKAQGDYVAILDDDDFWIDPDKLDKQLRFLDAHPDYVGCGGGLITIDEVGDRTGRFLKPEHDSDIRRVLLSSNPMAHSSTMFRRSVAAGIGNYDERIKECADWDFWLKMALKGKLYNFREYFFCYRMWSQGISFIRQREVAASSLQIIRRYRGSYPRYNKALMTALVFSAYAKLPGRLRQLTNRPLSRFKKSMFAR